MKQQVSLIFLIKFIDFLIVFINVRLSSISLIFISSVEFISFLIAQLTNYCECEHYYEFYDDLVSFYDYYYDY